MRALLLLFTAVSVLVVPQDRPEPVISVGHAGPPEHVVFTGNFLVTAEWSNVAVIDLSSGLTVGRLPQGSLVTSLAASPQGDIVAVGSCQHGIQLWNVRSRTLIRRFPLAQECPDSLSFSPDGSLLANDAYSCQRKGVQVWETGTGELVRELAAGTGIRHVTFSGDGRWLAAVDDKGSARLFEWPSGRVLRTFEGLGDTGYSGWAAMASGNGRYFAWKGHGLRVWDVSSGVEVPLPGARTVTVWNTPSDGPERRWTEQHVTADAAAFLQDGRLAFVSDDELITMRLPDGPREALSLEPAEYDHFGDIAIARPRSWLAIRRDGMLLAGSRGSKTVLWDLAAKRLRELSAPALTWPQSLRWSSRGLVAWADLGAGLRGWDDGQGVAVDFRRSVESADGLAFRPDGARLAVADGSSVLVLDLRNRRVMASRESPSFGEGIAYAPDGAWIAFESSGRFVLFDGNLRRGGSIATLEEHTSVEHAAFSPDGKWIAAGLGGPNPSLRVWPVDRSNQNAATLDTSRLTYGPQPPGFSSDSRRLASFTRGTTLTIWSTADWRIERSWSLTGSGAALAFAPTGARLAVATHEEAAVWDADTGRKRVTLSTSDPLNTTGIAWSPDGDRLATSADDGVLRFWNASNGGLLASLYTLEEGSDWLLVAADGRLDGSEGALTRLVAWRAGDRVFHDQALTARRRVRDLWRLLSPVRR